jgi:hypothetical protein
VADGSQTSSAACPGARVTAECAPRPGEAPSFGADSVQQHAICCGRRPHISVIESLSREPRGRAWRRSSSAPEDLLPDVRGLAGDSASLSAAPAAWRAQRGRCFCCAPCAQGTCPTPVLAPQRARPRRGAPTAPRGGSGCPRDHRARLEFQGSRNFRMGRRSSRGTGHRPDSALSAALGRLPFAIYLFIDVNCENAAIFNSR